VSNKHFAKTDWVPWNNAFVSNQHIIDLEAAQTYYRCRSIADIFDLVKTKLNKMIVALIEAQIKTGIFCYVEVNRNDLFAYANKVT
jgi:hypothetical protein